MWGSGRRRQPCWKTFLDRSHSWAVFAHAPPAIDQVMLQTAAFVHLDLAVHLDQMMNDDADDADEIDINDDYYD